MAAKKKTATKPADRQTEEDAFEAANPAQQSAEPARPSSVTVMPPEDEEAPPVELQVPDETKQALAETKPEWFSQSTPVDNARKLRAIVEWQLPALAEQMPRHFRVDRVVSAVLFASSQNPDLLQCTQGSWAQALIVMAQTGLEVGGVSGEAYLVPFNRKVSKKGERDRYEKRVQFMPGYRGLARLARNSGEIDRIEAHVVFENDAWEYELGLNPKLRHVPALAGDRGKPVLAYALATFKDGGYQVEVMSHEEIEKVRKVSKAANFGPWKDWWDQMARKTVFRRLAKWLPWNGDPAMTLALEADAAEYAVEIRGKVNQLKGTQDALRALPMLRDLPMPSDPAPPKAGTDLTITAAE